MTIRLTNTQRHIVEFFINTTFIVLATLGVIKFRSNRQSRRKRLYRAIKKL